MRAVEYSLKLSVSEKSVATAYTVNACNNSRHKTYLALPVFRNSTFKFPLVAYATVAFATILSYKVWFVNILIKSFVFLKNTNSLAYQMPTKRGIVFHNTSYITNF
jgi:uncharacterized membrane protein